MKKNKTKSIILCGVCILVIFYSGIRILRDPAGSSAQEEDIEEAQTYNTDYYGEETSDARYVNGVYDYTFSTGAVLTVGVNSTVYDGIYLDPTFTDPYNRDFDDSKVKYAFQLHTSYQSAISCDTNNIGSWSSDRYYYLTGRTFDTLVAASNLRWYDPEPDIAEPGNIYRVQLVVYRYPDYHMIAAAEIDILYTGKEYMLSDIKDLNVMSSEILTENEKELLLERAYSFMEDTGYTGCDLETYEWQLCKNDAVIIKPNGTYFPKLYDAEGQVTGSYAFSNVDLYAINIPYPTIGNVTVYAAPEEQLWGLTGQGTSATDNLTICGYEPVCPYSRDSLVCRPEERRSFCDY